MDYPKNDLGIIQEERNLGMELPKNQDELQSIIDEAVSKATETLVAKHNSDMASMRKKHESELAKAKEQASMSAEEIAQQKLQEQQKANEEELIELRNYKKQSIIADKLAEAKLPQYFKNDSRLLNAEEGDYDKVIKSISKEYAESLPKGATHSTITQTQSGKPQTSGGDEKSVAFEQMGSFLKEVVNN